MVRRRFYFYPKAIVLTLARTVNAELAATLHAMALLGVRSSVGSELEADDRTVDGDLRFNDECVLPNEARDEARALYDKLDTVTDKSEVRLPCRCEDSQ